MWERIAFALGMLVFCVLFITLFIPFNISEWIVYTSPVKNNRLLFLGIFCGILILFSQTVQYFLFRKSTPKNIHLILGFLLDILVLSLPLSIFYSIPTNSFWTEFAETIKIVVPAAILGNLLGFALLNILKKQNSKKETPQAVSGLLNQRINISDTNGQLKLSLKPEDLLFFEAADNYVYVFYRKNEEIRKEIIRNSLKNLEPEMADYGLIRCHRSFLVNTQNIFSIKKEGRSYRIYFEGHRSFIPVSRNYVSSVISHTQPN